MKKFVFPFILIAFLSLFFVKCGFGDAADKAEKTVDMFYDHVKSKNYDAIIDLLDNEALKAES